MMTLFTKLTWIFLVLFSLSSSPLRALESTTIEDFSSRWQELKMGPEFSQWEKGFKKLHKAEVVHASFWINQNTEIPLSFELKDSQSNALLITIEQEPFHSKLIKLDQDVPPKEQWFNILVDLKVFLMAPNSSYSFSGAQLNPIIKMLTTFLFGAFVVLYFDDFISLTGKKKIYAMVFLAGFFPLFLINAYQVLKYWNSTSTSELPSGSRLVFHFPSKT